MKKVDYMTQKDYEVFKIREKHANPHFDVKAYGKFFDKKGQLLKNKENEYWSKRLEKRPIVSASTFTFPGKRINTDIGKVTIMDYRVKIQSGKYKNTFREKRGK